MKTGPDGIHEVGKGILAKVGMVLQEAAKDLDLAICHRGDDEFLVGFRDQSKTQAKVLINRVVDRLNIAGVDVRAWTSDGELRDVKLTRDVSPEKG